MKLEHKYSERVIERGEEYVGAVLSCIKVNNTLHGQVQGSSKYTTEVDLHSLEGDCSCPYGTNCKHAVALYLTYKNGKFWDAEEFIKSLDTMSHAELKELILSKLKENPDWIRKYGLRKSVPKKNFVEEFKRKFSSELISEAEALLPDLSFEQLIALHTYISKNYDDLAEKLLEEAENRDSYYDYDDETYDKELSDLNEELAEIIIARALSEKKTEQILKSVYLREEIIKNAESFASHKEKIKKLFKKHECLEFLLNLKNPRVSEITKYVDEDDKNILYNAITEKSPLIREIASAINDKALLFSVAMYEKDFDTIVSNFSQFDNALKAYYDLTRYLGEVVELLMAKKLKNEEIAKKFLSRHIGGKYTRKQVVYLASQILDAGFLKKAFKKEHMETDAAILERLAQINKEDTLAFIKSKKDFLHAHWSDIVPLFAFLKKYYSVQIIKKYVQENQDFFRTSSHLKKHLKEECGIFISLKEGILSVEVRG